MVPCSQNILFMRNMALNSSKELFKYFIGSWDINRIVGPLGFAQGVAKFVPKDPNNILFREDLKVIYNHTSKPESAYKEYLYMYDQENEKIMKKFVDDRLFYELEPDFNNRKAYGEHLCDCDNYKATYTFLDEDSFILSYEVRGPQKDYVIETKYERIKTDDMAGIENGDKSS